MKPMSNKTTPLWDDSKEEYKACQRSNRQQAKFDISQEVAGYQQSKKDEYNYLFLLNNIFNI